MMKPIPEKTHSAFEAHGAALARWQLVETALYFLVHASLNTKEALSSTVFFHIRSPTAKVQLADSLLWQALKPKVYKEAWTSLRKELFTAAESRNDLAHFEMQAIVYKTISAADDLVIRPELTEPFHNVSTHQKEKVRTYNQDALEGVGREYRELSARLMTFVEQHFGIQALPQELVRQGRERAHLLATDKMPARPKS